TMQAYWQAKQRLFTEYPAHTHLINLDDPYGYAWCEAIVTKKQALDSSIQLMGYSLKAEAEKALPGLRVLVVTERQQGSGLLSAWCKTPWGEGLLTFPGI